jgi:hypothetical protein
LVLAVSLPHLQWSKRTGACPKVTNKIHTSVEIL